MKKNIQRWAGLSLALLITAGVLSGCGEKAPESSGPESSGPESSGPVSSAPESSAVSSDPDASSPEETGAFNYGDGLEDDGRFAGVKALDYVKLPEFSSIEIPEGTGDVTDADLKTRIDSLLVKYNEKEQRQDRAVEDGDTVNIDYVGSVDGVEFAGGNTQGGGTEVTIGVTSYIDDFLEQLIGHKPGDKFDVNVTFPDPYENNPDLAGKDAVFVTTINYIVDDKYKEADNGFVEDKLKEVYGWSSVGEMEEGLREQMEKEALGQYLWEQVGEKAEIKEVPAAILDYHTKNIKHYYTVMANQYGLVLKDFLQQSAGVDSLDALVEKEDIREMLETNAKNSLLYQAVAEQMNYTVTDEIMADYFRKEMSGEEQSQMEGYYGKPYLRLMIRESLIPENMPAGW